MFFVSCLQTFAFTVLGFFGGSPDKPKKVGKHAIETLNGDPAYFHICGESKANVNLAKKKLQDLINDQYHCLDIRDKRILRLSQEDSKRITDIQRRLGISIRTENDKEQLLLVISGHKYSVFEASNEINEMLRKTKGRDAELAGLMVLWQYQSHGSQFKNFPPETSYELEQALKKNSIPRSKSRLRVNSAQLRCHTDLLLIKRERCWRSIALI